MRIHKDLTARRELFVYNLFMATPDLNFQSVNDALTSENHKDLWHTPKDAAAKPLMMAFKRVEELRQAAKRANEDVANGLPIPPIPPSSLKRVKAVKAEIVAEAPAGDDTVVISEPVAEVVTDATPAVADATPAVTNDNTTQAA